QRFGGMIRESGGFALDSGDLLRLRIELASRLAPGEHERAGADRTVHGPPDRAALSQRIPRRTEGDGAAGWRSNQSSQRYGAPDFRGGGQPGRDLRRVVERRAQRGAARPSTARADPPPRAAP